MTNLDHLQEYLTIEPGYLSTRSLHGYLLAATSPRPIAFASTISSEGIPNLAPFSFFNVFSSNPPILIFSPARRVHGNTTKHTLENIIQTPEVVINAVSYNIVQQMNLASSEYPEGVNEFEKAGFTQLASDLVHPPRVGESPVQMECEVFEIKPLADEGGSGNLIFCRVVKLHISRAILDEKGYIDPYKMDLVGRMGGNLYSRTSQNSTFEVRKPGIKPGIGVDAFPASVRYSRVLTGNDLGIIGSVEAFPSRDEVVSWWNSNKQIVEGKDLYSLHKAAQIEIYNGNLQQAVQLLMGADIFRNVDHDA